MPDLGVPELLIIAVIVLLLFGPAKAGDIGGALGKNIRAFRQESREDGDSAPHTSVPAVDANTGTMQAASASSNAANDVVPAEMQPATPARPTATAVASSSRPLFCTECGNRLGSSHKFCVACGTPVEASTAG